MKSLKWKFVIMYVFVVFIAMVASGTVIFVNFRANGESSARRDLSEAVHLIIHRALFDDPDYEELRRRVNPTAEHFNLPGLEFNIISGTLPSRTHATTTMNAEEFPMFPVYTSPAVISAVGGNSGFYFGRRFSTVPEGFVRRYAGYAVPFFGTDAAGETADTVKYVLYVRKDVESVYESISNIIEAIVLSLFFALLATVLVGIIFAGSLTKPLAELTKKTRELTVSRTPEKIPVLSTDEVGQLTEGFNAMASSLAENVAEIVREKNRNEIVLYNMTDGVLAYDAAGSLIHYNNACYELLNFTNINGMTFDEMMESLGIAIPESEFYSDDQSRDITIFINDRYLNATYNPYRDKSGAIEGVIIVLQDITRHKKLDNMRKEFVANVSHEIRTPLTTIKGYAEILLDGEIDNRENAVNFLNVINGETDRMMLLVNDLLELSRSDYDRMELNMKEIDLLALVEQNVEYHKITAAKQNKTITFNSSLRRANVCVDPDRINQVINNIITNSFKYSAENAAVNVSVEPSESYYRVYVRDNGMGIPKEDLARIFERFYRVDKARSRAMGGTGLGLSIAQEIMESHGGKITAVSEFGKGTTMILRFPKIGEIPLEE